MTQADKGGRKPRVTDKDLLDVFHDAEDPVLSTAEVAESVPIKRRGTLNRLRGLEDAGDLESKQIGGRNTVWWLVDERDVSDTDRRSPATADAALISVEPAEWSDRVLGLDERPAGWRPAEKYDRVTKSGRTTGVTDGLVFSLDADIRVKVAETGDDEDIRVEFAPVYVGTVATSAGDSGSLWIAEEDNHAVGLHFAGGGGVAAAVPWPAVRAAVGELSFVEPPNGDADEDTGRGVLPGAGRWLRRLFAR